MVEADWRKILSFSQKELLQADKEELCESLLWVEVDDIDLNFSDLKTLFKLAQDILKYKCEEVKNLFGELNTIQRKCSKKKSRNGSLAPNISSYNALETITHQEEVIKANKDILEQLYVDIAELEERKIKYKDETSNIDKESGSSPDVISEMDTKAELENEIFKKNRHIRKVLAFVKILEEENAKFKEKISILKDKLKEATTIIEDLTEQILNINNECNRLKECLGYSEQAKSGLLDEINALKEDFLSKNVYKDHEQEDIKAKIQHLKNVVRAQRTDIENLTIENKNIRDLMQTTGSSSELSVEKENQIEELRIRELGDKLVEASNEILRSAKLIDNLRAENNQLKTLLEETNDVIDSDVKNECDDGKERYIINKLKKKIKKITADFHQAEEMVLIREKEVLGLTLKLNLLQSDECVNTLLKALNNKKQQLKFKDEGIKSLIKDVNKLNKTVSVLQLENKTMRQRLNVNSDDKVPTEGILLEFYNLEQENLTLKKQLRDIENQLVTLEINNTEKHIIIPKYTKLLEKNGFSKSRTNEKNTQLDSECGKIEQHQDEEYLTIDDNKDNKGNINHESNFQILLEENEGLRKGLQEILNFLKDNSASSSGILALECPSLEALLHSLEARHAAGWFAPHMASKMELKAALGGKDALLTALHQSRKEIFDLMTQLSKESQKCAELQSKLIESQDKIKERTKTKTTNSIQFGEFSSWIFDKEVNDIDVQNKTEIEQVSFRRHSAYEQDVKNALIYFRNRYEILFDKMTDIAMRAADEKNKWMIQEENYKAQIENLTSLKTVYEDDISDISPGMVSSPCPNFIERKSMYLEQLYKNIRTSYENIKNELLENKKSELISAAKFESQIQNLIIIIVNLAEKIRCSLPEELFWKQNIMLNNIVIKYRQLMDGDVMKTVASVKLFARLEDIKTSAIDIVVKQLQNANSNVIKDQADFVTKVENTVTQTQLQEICSELETKNKQIEQLINKNMQLQELQANLIDDTLASENKEEISIIKQNIIQLNEENKLLKEQTKHVQNQLDIVSSQVKHDQQIHLDYETEISSLRHQILDLQSTGDSKAVIARLSTEVLVSRLQATESLRRVEDLKQSLIKEKELRADSEEALKVQQRIFEIFTIKYENKFRYMHEVLQTLRLQYQGSVPLTSAENYLRDLQEMSNKSDTINEKINEIEDLRYSLMTKHSVYDQILQLTRENCSEGLESCPHKLQLIIAQGTQTRELEHCNIKLQSLGKTHEKLLEQCKFLEKTLVLLNQGINKPVDDKNIAEEQHYNVDEGINHIEVEDIQSDVESMESGTFTLPKPRTAQLQNQIYFKSHEKKSVATSTNFPEKLEQLDSPEYVSVFVQTNIVHAESNNRLIQTEKDNRLCELNHCIKNLEIANKQKEQKLAECLSISDQRAKHILTTSEDNKALELKIHNLTEINSKVMTLNEQLHKTTELLKKEFENLKNTHIEQLNEIKNEAKEKNQSLMLSIKEIENEKNNVIIEYKQLLENEREESFKNIKDLQLKIKNFKDALDRKASTINVSNTEISNDNIAKYTSQNAELEDKCFKLQNSLEDYKTEVVNCQSELQRWKDLASERLEKMEQMSVKLKERHNCEVESYKAENQHWLVQLNETQHEHMELRTRLTEQKALYVKQLSDKDCQIEQCRSIIHNLKAQIMNMQTMLSVHDPSFDLSAIVEVEEASDGSQPGSDRLELKFDSTVDLHEMQDDFARMATSTTIWQEPIIERLRREKQLLSKQNGILRRQIKAIASRERRARLDAQNLKNQVFRISTSGSKAASAESAALHNKIASLQAQLTSARRDTHSSVALWDKWKRAQQATERWQAQYEEKCQEVNKIEASLQLCKSAVTRLEKEKRLLLARIADTKNEKQFVPEKQDREAVGKQTLSRSEYDGGQMQAVPVSTRALLDRIETQQRRIVALEVAERGKEPLVSEYEKALADITSLKGQVLKLESTLLETQIRSPLLSTQEIQPELEYWKSYCNMLKEENAKLTLRVSSLEIAPTTVHQHRVNDLEQTVLTLRGLVSKLQAEQKSSSMNVQKRVDSRPSSERNALEKTRSQLESSNTEISNLQRIIQEKDGLLERSKDMLRIAAQREDELLRENAYLRRQLEELTDSKRGSLSA